MRDLNSRPPACEADILPTELMAQVIQEYRNGINYCDFINLY